MWDTKVFDASKVRMGWWVQRREWDRVTKGGVDNAEGVLLGEGKIGRQEIDGNGEWWDAVLRGTGIKTGRWTEKTTGMTGKKW